MECCTWLVSRVVRRGLRCSPCPALSEASRWPTERQAMPAEILRSPFHCLPTASFSPTISAPGWIWVFDDTEGAVWERSSIRWDCSIMCPTGRSGEGGTAVQPLPVAAGPYQWNSDMFRRRCGLPDRAAYRNRRIELSHCVSGDRWTPIPVAAGSRWRRAIVVQVEWGPTGALQLASENTQQKLHSTWIPGSGFPASCSEWVLPPERSFIYVTDRDGDGFLEDLCQIYGAPDPIAFQWPVSTGTWQTTS